MNVGETTYTYERAEVTADGANGLAYVGDQQVADAHISEDIGCSVPADTRTCAFERYLLSNATIPTEVYTNNPAAPFDIGTDRYEYVAINGSVYDVSYVGNRSARRDDGLYRIDLALERTTAANALRHVSIDVSSENGEVPPVVIEAAKRGTATADRTVAVPRTPLRIEGDEYYRVFLTGTHEPTRRESALGFGLSIGGPIIGLYLLYRLSHRFEIRYGGANEGRR
jgi:predicted heme/steroid binding protein